MKLGLSGLYEAFYLYKWDCTANYANYPNSLVCPIHCPASRPEPEFQQDGHERERGRTSLKRYDELRPQRMDLIEVKRSVERLWEG